ncbi:GAF and ANTAR domain-containing protein [Leifsonia sp. SIMBA_070]|uniref:GAF and ANTAR domain-containing protein n=1 Tax=Leifsonia sp. SIMBA_070 TaxID=3085810 RepID=UPI00397AD9BB
MLNQENGPDEHDVDLPAVFVLLADALRPEFDVIDTMDVLIEASTRFTSAAEGGIMLADRDGTLHVVASTSESAAETEEYQLWVAEGPCLETAHTGTLLDIPDLRQEADRWPHFTRIAADRGFVASHTFPLSVRGETIGALNLFSTRLGKLDDRETSLIRALCEVATIAVLQQRSLHEQTVLSEQLQQALDSRVLIEQAKGVIAQKHRVPIDQAFRMLRTHARTTNARLHDVADAVVNRRLSL